MPKTLFAEPARSMQNSRTLRERIAALEADNIRLRAAVIERDSALAFARQDNEDLKNAAPGLPRRAELARKVETLAERVQSLMRERPPQARTAIRA
ncbi:hypothetical protein GT347_00275 [Xylophilus rhododendri]|uniref:Uncharacterized protein n=1 Tax=Xylophilus rhododendri TaxID=2697032 RepID=A0A857IZ44_9BURK|nr:hypothetical protein [Xylophilus rhododendri]QHI96567.1 hypothetical protein GT347_00275 [Xylophilus rhododendri]